MSQSENASSAPVLIIVMGVSGSGKSSVASALASAFNLTFYEADDYHSDENKAHMAAGKPLTDAMREPWIQQIYEALQSAYKKNKHCVLAYSGLRRAHRRRFKSIGFRTKYILLSGEASVITQRMKNRSDHFMPSSLLSSQLASLDTPLSEEHIIEYSIDKPLNTLISDIKRYVADEFNLGLC